MTPKEQFNDLTKTKALTAREYFQILRLAIYHHSGELLDSSVDIAHYPKNSIIYKTAVGIAEAL